MSTQFQIHQDDQETAARRAAFIAKSGPEALANFTSKFDLNRVTKSFPGTFIEQRNSSLGDALKIAGADFEVAKAPVLAVLNADLAVEVKGKAALYRTDSNEPLGIAGDTYGIVQNREAFRAAGELAEQGKFDIASIEVVGNGELVRLHGVIGQSAIRDVPGFGPDVIAHYATFEAGHDGWHGHGGALNSIRTWCLNGATVRDRLTSWTGRHTSKASKRNDEAQAFLLQIYTAAEFETLSFQKMAHTRMGTDEYRAFAKQLLKQVLGDIEDEKATERKIENRKQAIEELETLFTSGVGNFGETRWDAYNSVTEWVTARRENAKDAIDFAKKYQSQIDGHNAKFRAKARALLVK